jgi:hypothetical protein
MPRVAAVADLHGNLPEDLPDGDVLVVAGDVCPLEDHSVGFQREWLERSFYPWLGTLPHPEIVWIAGNHDFACQSAGWEPGGRGTYLLDSGTTAAGLTFYGTPWVPKLRQWAFYAGDEEREERFARIPAVDVLVSHGPPLGHGDRLTDGRRAGCPFLAKRIAATATRLCAFGHIHEDRGLWTDGPTTLANVAHVDEHYVVRPGGARAFDLEPDGNLVKVL